MVSTVVVNGRSALRLERRLPHDPEQVWAVVSTAERLGRWYPFPVAAFEARVGGRLAFDYEGGVIEATLTDFDPKRRVFAFDEHDLGGSEREFDDHVRVEVRAGEGGGSVVVLTHVPTDTSNAEGVEAGWRQCLDRLAAEMG
ncbi:SRPBCC domain-containing protein [Streptomycetaceae bacterium NBC_01309]